MLEIQPWKSPSLLFLDFALVKSRIHYPNCPPTQSEILYYIFNATLLLLSKICLSL